ncbi:MAG: RagB/SusD family nutrient uptake outer membrane protein, partial [Balneolaceae bacterium]
LNASTFEDERAKEMFQESIRRTDQIRFNSWGEAWWEKAAHSNDYKNIMPIPLDQINATTDGSLTQHPDYS